MFHVLYTEVCQKLGYEDSSKKTPFRNQTQHIKKSTRHYQLVSLQYYLIKGERNLEVLKNYTRLTQQNIARRINRFNKIGSVFPPMRKKKLEDRHEKYLSELVLAHQGLTTLKAMKESMESHFAMENLRVSTEIIRKCLEKMNYSFHKTSKVIVNRNSQETKLQRKVVVKYIISLLETDYEIIYVDECSFQACMAPTYAWAKKGKRLPVVVEPKSVNITLLAAMSRQGLIGIQIFSGAAKSEDFNGFLVSLWESEGADDDEVRRAIFLDNSPTHHNRS